MCIESKAAGSVNDYYFRPYSATSSQLNIYGSLDEFGGDFEQMLPSGTLTVRIPLNLYNLHGGNVNMSSDFMKVVLQGSSVTVNRLVDKGDINIRVLSLDLLFNDSKVPMLISSSDWSTGYFDVSALRQNSEFSVQDSLFFEVTLFYEIQSALDGSGQYATFPEVAFTVTVASPCLILNGYDSLGSLKESMQEQNRLQQEQNDLQEKANDIAEEQKENEKSFFDGFFGNLIDAIVGVFVPSSDELSGLFDRLNQFFSDTFGFLYYPFDFIIQAFNVFLSSDSSTGLTLPAFSIMGYQVWGDLTYDIGADAVAGSIFSYVRIGTGAILGMFFIGYLRNFFEKRFGGGGN